MKIFTLNWIINLREKVTIILRVLHCVNKMDKGGIETLLMNIYRNIDREKVQFDFLLTSSVEGEYDKEIKQLGGRIYNVRSRRIGLIQHKIDLNSFFKEHNYETVHIHVSSLTNIQTIKTAAKNKVPNRIIHSHNTKGPKGIFHEMMHRYNRLIIDRYCTDKFACSNDAAIWAFGKTKSNSKSVKIFNNSIKTSTFAFNKNVRETIRNDLNLRNKFVIGHVGRIVEQKNHTFIIKIFKEIIAINPNALLVLVGVGSLEKKIRLIVKDLELDKSVIFLGSRSDVSDLMQAMDVFLFPSLFEGLGLVAIEAQTCGLRVIASDVVPKEAAVTELFHPLNLSLTPRLWAEKTLNVNGNKERRDWSKEIIEKGYDIEENVEWIKNYYLNKK